MVGTYGRSAKINNAVGRADYITDEKRQEEIVMVKSKMTHSWEVHSQFEKENQKSNDKNVEALEVHIALPNELYLNKDKLEKVCDDLVSGLVGENKDYQYAVHWNHKRTNFHVHILFSERENQIELEPKVYKRDYWQDKITKQMTKVGADGAELRYKKGEIQRDKDGNIKYQTNIFKTKDTRFVKQSWVFDKNRIIAEVMNSHGFNFEVQTKGSPFLSQKKLFKGARVDYLEKAAAWNVAVKKYNKLVKKVIEENPADVEKYQYQKKKILQEVKVVNSIEKKISNAAIDLIYSYIAEVEKGLEVPVWKFEGSNFGEIKNKIVQVDNNWYVPFKYSSTSRELSCLDANGKKVKIPMENIKIKDKSEYSSKMLQIIKKAKNLERDR